MNKKQITLEVTWKSTLEGNKRSGLLAECVALSQLCSTLLNPKVGA